MRPPATGRPPRERCGGTTTHAPDHRRCGRGGDAPEVDCGRGGGRLAQKPDEHVMEHRARGGDRCDQAAADPGQQDIAQPQWVPLSVRGRAHPVQGPHRRPHCKGHRPAQDRVAWSSQQLALVEAQDHPDRPGQHSAEARHGGPEPDQRAQQQVDPPERCRTHVGPEPPVAGPERSPDQEPGQRRSAVRLETSGPGQDVVEGEHGHAEARQRGHRGVEGPAERGCLAWVLRQPPPGPQRKRCEQGQPHHGEGDAERQLALVPADQCPRLERPAQKARET